jgi:hypothetical protein
VTEYPAPPPYPGPQAPPPPAAHWAAGSTRELAISVGTARTALLQAIRSLDFETTSEQYSLIRAERGSLLRGLSLTRTRVPTALDIGLTPDGTGVKLEIRVEDRWPTAARSSAAAAVYADVFTEVLARLDEALKLAAPNAEFPQWWRLLPESIVAAGAGGAGVAARWDESLQRRASRLLDGPRRQPATAAAGTGVDAVTFTSPDAAARIAAEVVDGMLTAGQLVAATPGTMPRPLVEQVQAMVVLLEERLAEAGRGGWTGEVTVPITAADKPVITFLYQQAALREKLPVRLLMTCTTCRLEKVVNPDFQRLRERNRRVKILQTSVGAVLGAHQISPFILVGRLAQLKKTDPDFVCVRCQGIDADQQPITFCSRCGDRRDESALVKCAKCSLDLRSLLPRREVWSELEAAPQPPPSAEPKPPPAPLSATRSAPATTVVPVMAPFAPDIWSVPTMHHGTDGPAGAPPMVPGAAAADAPALVAGWYRDPWRRFEIRFWDGAAWSVHVGSGGVLYTDAPAG